MSFLRTNLCDSFQEAKTNWDDITLSMLSPVFNYTFLGHPTFYALAAAHSLSSANNVTGLMIVFW